MRRALRAWLDGVGVPFGDAQDLVLAVDEAVTNAIEHSMDLPDRAGGVDVEARMEEATRSVVVEIADRGTWAGPRLGTLHGGRGLMLMNALCDRVDIEHGDGTVVRLSRRPRPIRVLAPAPAGSASGGGVRATVDAWKS